MIISTNLQSRQEKERCSHPHFTDGQMEAQKYPRLKSQKIAKLGLELRSLIPGLLTLQRQHILLSYSFVCQANGQAFCSDVRTLKCSKRKERIQLPCSLSSQHFSFFQHSCPLKWCLGGWLGCSKWRSMTRIERFFFVMGEKLSLDPVYNTNNSHFLQKTRKGAQTRENVYLLYRICQKLISKAMLLLRCKNSIFLVLQNIALC